MMDSMDKNFIFKTKAYYEDTDAGGIVYYANYLKFFERARTEWIYSLGLKHNILNEKNIFIVVKSCQIDFVKPVKFEEEIDIVTKLTKLSPVRITMLQSAHVSGEDRVKGIVELAIIDGLGKPIKMPKHWLDLFKSCI